MRPRVLVVVEGVHYAEISTDGDVDVRVVYIDGDKATKDELHGPLWNEDDENWWELTNGTEERIQST
jgi:copper(I)-binding protein